MKTFKYSSQAILFFAKHYHTGGKKTIYNMVDGFTLDIEDTKNKIDYLINNMRLSNITPALINLKNSIIEHELELKTPF